jgi:hypothetical protein
MHKDKGACLYKDKRACLENWLATFENGHNRQVKVGKNIAFGKMGKLFLKIRIREDGQKSNCYFSVLNASVFISSLSFLFHV